MASRVTGRSAGSCIAPSGVGWSSRSEALGLGAGRRDWTSATCGGQEVGDDVEAGLPQPHSDRLFADAEVLSKITNALDAVAPGELERPLCDECTAREVVCGGFGLLGSAEVA